MIGMSIDKAKSNFFDRPAVIDRIGPARAEVGMKAGGLVRTIARRSMRKARQKRLGELTAKERQRFRMLQRIYKKKGLDPRKVRRPLMHSRPGEPPRTIRGDIKKHLFFAFDPQTESTVIGPALLNSPTGAPETLEYGGQAEINGRTVKIAPRPYMNPARDKAAPKFAQFWKDAVRRHY